MDVKAVLEQVGLSDGEQKVYLALLELGESTSGPIADKSGVSASKVYQVIERLMKKGLAGEVVKKGSKHFKASNPKAIVDYLQERKRELNEIEQAAKDILPALKAQFDEKTGETEVQLFRGMKSFRNLYADLLGEMKPKEDYFVIGASVGLYDEFSAFFSNYHKQRAEKGVNIRMLFQQGVLPPDTDWRHAKKQFLPAQFRTPFQVTVYKDVTLLQLLQKEPLVFKIKNEEVAAAYRQFFDTLWNQKVQTYRGPDGIKQLLMEAADEPEIKVLGGGGYVTDYFPDWFKETYLPKIKKTGHRWRNLVLPSIRGHKVTTLPFAETRYLPPGEYSPTVMWIAGDMVANVIWEDEPVAFVVRNKKIAKAYTQYFEAMWQQESQTLKGEDAIPMLVDDVLNTGEDLYLISATGDIVDRYPEEYQRLMDASKQGKVKRYFLSQERTRGMKFNTQYVEEVTYLPDEFLSPLVVWVYGDRVAQVIWEEEITVFLVRNKKVADDYRTYYRFLTEFARKPLKTARRSK